MSRWQDIDQIHLSKQAWAVLRHTGHVSHDDVEGLYSIHGNLLTAALQRLLQCIETDLSHELDSHTEHPVPTLTRQCHLQLHLAPSQTVNN